MHASKQTLTPSFSSRVLDWFKRHGRKKLPWQQNPSPYRVWVSEIMLQQTQVATVIPYFERFMQRFPAVGDLAIAEEDQVLHYWTGLGYYARARNLHKTARLIQQKYQCQFPDSVELLEELPGIGRSTAGAIVALALNKRAVILDGNVKRVLCRYHCVEGWPEQSQTLKNLWQLAEQHTPDRHCRDYTQAMMDLGATVCTRSQPDCEHCPLKAECLACQSKRCDEFPQRKPRKSLPVKSTHMLILLSPDQQKVLLEKRPAQGIWGGLWSFPEYTDENEQNSILARLALQSDSSAIQLDNIRHTFSHFHLEIKPRLHCLDKLPTLLMEKPGLHWYDLKKPSELGLAAPVKTLLGALEKAL